MDKSVPVGSISSVSICIACLLLTCVFPTSYARSGNQRHQEVNIRYYCDPPNREQERSHREYVGLEQDRLEGSNLIGELQVFLQVKNTEGEDRPRSIVPTTNPRLQQVCGNTTGCRLWKVSWPPALGSHQLWQQLVDGLKSGLPSASPKDSWRPSLPDKSDGTEM